ncbi:MAG TPA: hypothetical protein VEB66_06570 [Opitutaceae bacterium]|nr:hypothetical protein [Opitutaceae bacterium]
MRAARHPERGAVVLVALCFAAVLAISVASYLALSRSAMTLSNRSFQTDLSKNLAEAGLEVAMDAFNTNDWSAWTTSGTTATRTVTFTEGAAKFGSIGVVGSIKLRVDNYNAYNLNATWSSTATYRPDNVVGHNGLWYRALTTHLGKTPSSTSAYWVPEHISSALSLTWQSGVAYAIGEMAGSNGALYRCVSAHTSGSTTKPGSGASWATYWVLVPYFSVDSDLHYTNESILHYYGTWYRYYSGWQPISGGAWTTSWYWQSGVTYSLGDVVYSSGFYRYKNASPSAGNAVTNTTYWEPLATDSSTLAVNWPWDGSANYEIGDVVHTGGSWYRCIRPHSNATPPNAAYWSNAPLLSREWDPKWQYAQNDTVFYQGKWYLSIYSGTNYGNVPPTGSTATTLYWARSDDAARQWSATTGYTANTYRSYGGVWYRCLVANTGKTPNESTYWAASWAQSSGATTGAPVIYSEGIATPADNSPAMRTQLRASVGRSALFPNAVAAASGAITLGATTTVDSYDSVSDPTASTPGASAVLASTATSGSAVSLSSATVRGYVAAPGANTSGVTYSGSAALNDGSGTVASPAGSAANVDLARISRSPYIPELDIQSVAGGTEITSVSNLVLGTPGAVTPSVYYCTSSLDLNTSAENITVVGPVILSLTGSSGLRIRSTTSARMRITDTGSLRLHVARDFRLESTGGGIVNETLDPTKLVVLLSRNGTDTFQLSNSNTPFYGAIYLPNSSSTFTIGDNVQVFGAISARNVTLTGAARLHYDTQLRHKAIRGVDQAFVITDWRELAASERASL